MARHKSIVVALLATFVVLVTGHLSARAQTADQLLDALERTYNQHTGLRADFTQTMSSAYSDFSESFSGTLLLKGNRYRVETERQTLVTDGDITWIYNADENQVLINQNSDSDDALSVDHLFSGYAARFDVSRVDAESVGGRRHHVLHLNPKDPASFFAAVTVWMRADDNVISRIRIVDQNETTMLFDLNNVDLNARVDEQAFTFSPPQGVEVIDLRL